MRAYFVASVLILTLSVADARVVDISKIINSKIPYTQPSNLKIFPAPVIDFKRGGLAKKDEIDEITKKFVYPIIRDSTEPIATIVVEFHENKPNQIGVGIYFYRNGYAGSLFYKNQAGHFDDNAYKDFFVECKSFEECD